jgi:muramoyltetrapeptide carboxypeptidase
MKEIRVIAPSDSWKADREASYKRAQRRLEAAGYTVSYAMHLQSIAYLGTANARQRAEDFNNAFKDESVAAIIALHGGFSANDILPYIDWEAIKSNPKPLIGYSDITALINAVYAMTGITAYLGPNFGTIGYEKLWRYTLDRLMAATSGDAHQLLPSSTYLDNGIEYQSMPWHIINQGSANGILLGGNIQTLFLLQGTKYQLPFDKKYVLAIEDDSLTKEYTLHGFSRNLESLLQLPNARQNLQGIIIGRFEAASSVDSKDLSMVLRSKNLNDIPIISNLDFGHTTPLATLPVGGTVSLIADKSSVKITLNA